MALADIFFDGAFAIETCCEGMHECLCAQDEEAWREQLLALGRGLEQETLLGAAVPA